MTFNEPISRISASSFNSAAFNEKNKMFFWGSANYHKMGIDKKLTTVDSPIFAEWKIEKTGFYTETGKGAMRHQLQFIDSSLKRALPKGTQILSSIRDITWGDSHCVMLDTKGRLFSMGAS